MNILILSSSSRHFPLDIQVSLQAAGLEAHRLQSLNEFIASPLRKTPFLAILEVGTTEDIDRALVAYEWAETVQPLAAARYLLLLGSKHISLHEKSSRFRGVEIAQLPLPAKNLMFKVELQLKVLGSEAKSKAGKKIEGFSAEIREAEKQRVMVIRGPGPDKGGWKNSGDAPQGRTRWRWIDDPPKKGRPEEAFSWQTESKTAPEFNPQIEAWEVKDPEADLQCHHGGIEIFSTKKIEAAKAAAGESGKPSGATGPQMSAGSEKRNDSSANPAASFAGAPEASAKRNFVGANPPPGGEAPAAISPSAKAAAQNAAPAVVAGKNPAGAPSALHPSEPAKDPSTQSTTEKTVEQGATQASSSSAPPVSAPKLNPRPSAPSSASPGAGLAPARASATAPRETERKAETPDGPVSTGAAPREKSAPSEENKAIGMAAAAKASSAPSTSESPLRHLKPKQNETSVSADPVAAKAAAPDSAPPPSAQDSAPKTKREPSLDPSSAPNLPAEKSAPGASFPGSSAPHTRGGPGFAPVPPDAPPAPHTPAAESPAPHPAPTPRAPAPEFAHPHTRKVRTEVIETVEERPADPGRDTAAAFPEKTKEITGKIVIPTDPILSEPQNLVRASQPRDASERNVISAPAATKEETDHLKTRLFLTLSLEELQDQNSTWMPVEGYRIYLSARHRYYGIRDLNEVFPLWIYEGELAPEFLDLKKAWKFYDRLPNSFGSLETLPAPVAKYLIEQSGTNAKAEEGGAGTASAREEKKSQEPISSFTREKSLDEPSERKKEKPALFSAAWFAEFMSRFFGG